MGWWVWALTGATSAQPRQSAAREREFLQRESMSRASFVSVCRWRVTRRQGHSSAKYYRLWQGIKQFLAQTKREKSRASGGRKGERALPPGAMPPYGTVEAAETAAGRRAKGNNW
ncbi:CRISPR-associated protein Cas9/Csn1, subtype II/NMEMI [Edwardsiella piscicida]|nr:CRISPR-associated protein Cas9/Csn1, subtype II/NMEMI [Edwardsiella piscicida]